MLRLPIVGLPTTIRVIRLIRGSKKIPGEAGLSSRNEGRYGFARGQESSRRKHFLSSSKKTDQSFDAGKALA